MTNFTRLVGKRLRELRKQKSMTQEQLGEKAQLQSTYIGGVERGERNISLETLEKIMEALEIRPTEFFDLKIWKLPIL